MEKPNSVITKYFAVPHKTYTKIEHAITVECTEETLDSFMKTVHEEYPNAVELTYEQACELRDIFRANIQFYNKVCKK